MLGDQPVGAGASATLRVRHSDQAMPAARIAAVIASETAAGNFSQPIASATNTLAPMKTSSPASAYFR